MEKLELKHLSPYLPYGTQFEIQIHEIYKDSPKETRGLVLNQSNIDLCLAHGKLRLRPLSDLTKSITHNEETFVPMGMMVGVFGFDYLYSYCDKPQGYFNVYAVCFGALQYLFKWHFDIFGLIDKGLAIDMNTLNQ